MIRVPVEECRTICIEAYERNGVEPKIAALAAEQFILCDLLGIQTHGILRLSHYIGRLQAGGIEPGISDHYTTFCTCKISKELLKNIIL